MFDLTALEKLSEKDSGTLRPFLVPVRSDPDTVDTPALSEADGDSSSVVDAVMVTVFEGDGLLVPLEEILSDNVTVRELD